MPIPDGAIPTYTNPVAFRYVNHRGDDHEYVVRPESIEKTKDGWVMHAILETRDGDGRRELVGDGNRRRTFKLADMREVRVR